MEETKTSRIDNVQNYMDCCGSRKLYNNKAKKLGIVIYLKNHPDAYIARCFNDGAFYLIDGDKDFLLSGSGLLVTFEDMQFALTMTDRAINNKQ